MSTLLEIGADMQAMLSLLEESDGEIKPAHEAVLDEWFKELGTNQERKTDAYVSLIKEMEGRAKIRKEERDRLAVRVRVDEATAERLKERLKFYMEQTRQKTIETRRYKVGVQANGGLQPMKVTCIPAELPEQYQLKEIKPDTEAIRKALEAGMRIGGCELQPRGTQLRIR